MAVTGQFVPAREASYTMTAGSGNSEVITTVGFTDAAWSEWRDVHQGVPAGYLMSRVTLGVLNCRALLGGMYDKAGATPTSPGLASTPPTNPGTLVITFANGKTKTVTGFITRLDWNVSGGSTGGLQKYQWVFVGSAEGPTSTIVTA